MTFSHALGHLKAGKKVRRRGWTEDTFIVLGGSSIYIGKGSAIADWFPEPSDLLENDWEIME